jgi:CcmD family protein
MATFAAAYVIVWLVVVAYVTRLGLDQRRLARTLESLQSEAERAEPVATPGSEAA